MTLIRKVHIFGVYLVLEIHIFKYSFLYRKAQNSSFFKFLFFKN